MSKTFLAMLALSFSLSSFAELKPFTSDGCSKWIDGTIIAPDLWKPCCFQHDISYWMGGTHDEKENADQKLRQCVAEKDTREMGFIMWMGVKIGGGPEFKTSYRWGYGWDTQRGYQSLTEDEKRVVAQELHRTIFIGEERRYIQETFVEKNLPINF